MEVRGAFYGLLLRGGQCGGIFLDLIYVISSCVSLYLYVDATITLRGSDEVAIRIAQQEHRGNKFFDLFATVSFPVDLRHCTFFLSTSVGCFRRSDCCSLCHHPHPLLHHTLYIHSRLRQYRAGVITKNLFDGPRLDRRLAW